MIGNMIPESVYRRHLGRIHDGGNYFAFYRPYTKLMSKTTALFLQDLMNLTNADNIIWKTINGKEFFACTVDFLKKSKIGWTEKEQRIHFNKLRAKHPDGGSYIEMCKIGIPASRWVYINYEKLERDLDDLEDAEKKKPNSGDNNTGLTSSALKGATSDNLNGVTAPALKGAVLIKKNNNEKEVKENANLGPNLPTSRKIFSGGKYKKLEGEKDTECMRLAALLRESLQKNNCQCLGYTKSWAETIRIIRDIDKQEVTAIIEAYSKHCSKAEQEQYKLPTITQPKDLRRCFSWLEGALKRAGFIETTSVLYEKEGTISRVENPDGSITTVTRQFTSEGYITLKRTDNPDGTSWLE